jgi:hypothetical protein
MSAGTSSFRTSKVMAMAKTPSLRASILDLLMVRDMRTEISRVKSSEEAAGARLQTR